MMKPASALLLTLLFLPPGAVAAPAEEGPIASAPLVTQENVNDSYSGTWLWAEGNDRFELRLSEADGKITGFHSMQRESGGKADSVPTGSLPSINGEVHGTSTVVRFRSGALGSEGWGHARLTLRGRYLYWQLVDSTGDHLLPQNVVLIRQYAALR